MNYIQLEQGWLVWDFGSAAKHHKHDTDNLPEETRHDEVYNYRFKPGHGFGVQVMQYEDDKEGFGYQLFDGSTITKL